MYNNFVVEGDKMATEIIKQQGLKLEGIYALETWIERNASDLNNFHSILHAVSPKELGRISGLKTPNQVLIVCKIPTYSLDIPLINNSLTLFLDNLQNPGNMGSILRIADWFGLPYIFSSKNGVEVYNSKVIQASMGAFLRVKTIAIDFDELLAQFPDLKTYAAVLEGENVFQKRFDAKGLLIIGNEGKGISEAIQNKTTDKISIPKGAAGAAESLNAAVATGILCAALLNK
jgi:TrmH family RNA methyltransferase